jgi:pimeloyl-ACP methyl ester carboxylesterase
MTLCVYKAGMMIRLVFAVFLLIGSSEALAMGKKKPLVMLIPGAGSSGDRIYVNGLDRAAGLVGDHYFKVIQDQVKKRKLDAIVCPKERDQDSRTIEERAEDCVTQILSKRERCDSESRRDVLLLGHSMGGLIARSLAHDPRVQACVHSVTTVSTPHRGTPLADWAILHGELDDQGFDILGRFVNIIHFRPRDLHYLPQLRSGREGLDPAIFRAQDLPDQPGIDYYSITNSLRFNPIPFLEASRAIIADELRTRGLDQTEYGAANDGIVPEYSMVHGTVVGRLDAHHFATACIDPVKLTPGCQGASRMIVEHLSRVAPRQ